MQHEVAYAEDRRTHESHRNCTHETAKELHELLAKKLARTLHFIAKSQTILHSSDFLRVQQVIISLQEDSEVTRGV